jgi:ribosome-associated protein
VVLDLSQASSVTDYFVIGNGETERQIRALQEAVEEEGRAVGLRPLHVEGTPPSGWVLLDFGDVVVHIFAPEQRDYYQLERLWKGAPLIVSIQ